AMPGAALAEPDASAVWMGEPAAEPDLAAPVDELGPTSVEPQPSADDAINAPDVDLWAESFYPSTSTASVTAPHPAPQPTPRRHASRETNIRNPSPNRTIPPSDSWSNPSPAPAARPSSGGPPGPAATCR